MEICWICFQWDGLGESIGDSADKRPGGSGSDLYLNDSAYQSQRCMKDNDSIAHRVARELHPIIRPVRFQSLPLGTFFLATLFSRGESLYKHLLPRADKSLIASQADDCLCIEQDLITGSFDCLGHIVWLSLEGLRARTRTVFKDVAIFKVCGANQIERLFKLGLSFAAEADDEVARHGCIWNGLTDAAEHLHVVANRVAPLHPREHRIAAVLGRNMEVVADLGQISHG